MINSDLCKGLHQSCANKFSSESSSHILKTSDENPDQFYGIFEYNIVEYLNIMDLNSFMSLGTTVEG